ncbi:DNA starvation/stationary phase protection protein [Bacteroidia bacterium]|nr:DNA starvation/stationary phase protection protein [Bacteroidia bacterium]
MTNLLLPRKTNDGLTGDVKKRSVELMNGVLGTNFILMLKTWVYHWNMVGPAFHQTHLWFNDLYETLIDDVDSIAERVRAMGGVTLSSTTEMLKGALIEEQVGKMPSIPDMIKTLLNDYEVSIKQMRAAVAILDTLKPSDDGDLNFLQDLIMRREKDAWMLRSNLSS